MGRKISLYISNMNRPAAEQVLSKLTADFEITDHIGSGKIGMKAQFDDTMSKALWWAAQAYGGGRDTEPFVSSMIQTRRAEMQKDWDMHYAGTRINDTCGGLLSTDIGTLSNG